MTGNLSLLRGHYEQVLKRVAAAGVDVRVRFLKETVLDPLEFEASLREGGVRVDVARVERQVRFAPDLLALRLRELGNILRFNHRDYAGRTALADRALAKTARGVERWGRRFRRLGPDAAARVAKIAAAVEAKLPPSPSAVELIAAEAPDAIAVAPVIRIPGLVDYLKAADDTGVATAIWVQSWDNLTNKGLLHFAPDRVFVWNESQVEELERYHGVPSDRVSVTGAQTFDHWFEGDRPEEREAFCARLGVDPSQPIVLYLASSKQIAPEEPEFFKRWLTALRSSDDPALRSATVLVRPHPTLAELWHASGLDREEGVVMSPTTLANQINSAGFREQYRNELHHASVAVAINTSGFIDAAIFGKPTCTVELPELFHGQKGTVHYQHLTRPGSPLVRTAPSFDEHFATLAELIGRDPYAVDEQSAAFVARFVRPKGLDVSPTELFVRDVLELLKLRREPGAARTGASAVLSRAAFVLGVPFEERPLRSVGEHVVDRLWLTYQRERGRQITVAQIVEWRRRRRQRTRRLVKRVYRRGRRAVYAAAVGLLPRPLRKTLKIVLRRVDRTPASE